MVSFDRNHRGMIVQLLQDEFSERQVIIFTHDRDWYTELRYQLDAKDWRFRGLLPFETPDIGIPWSGRATGFDDARPPDGSSRFVVQRCTKDNGR